MFLPDATWQPLIEALDRAGEAGRILEIWLRDDDAVEPTAALERLTRLCEAHDLPVLLAVIPFPAGDPLARFVSEHPLLRPAQHGYRHTNHAAAGERARELGGTRPVDDVCADLMAGQRKMSALFGSGATRTLVPPWNRIDDPIVQALPNLGYGLLSTFGPVSGAVAGLRHLNCDVDIIDWRNGRVGRSHAKLVSTVVELIAAQADKSHPIGLLTHHLVHDETAWRFLETCIPLLKCHPAVNFKLQPDTFPSA